MGVQLKWIDSLQIVVCVVVLVMAAMELQAYQQSDSVVQHIFIRPTANAQIIGAHRRAKTTDASYGAVIRDDSKITVIQKADDATPIPWKYVNKRKSKFHPATGAYPVYYAIARTNGSFQGKRIRVLKPE